MGENMSWIRNWSEGIIISIIVATLVEMILPNNNSKKYIKIIIGIFVVYNIITPVIDVFAGKDIDQSLDINGVLQTSTSAYENYDGINQGAQNSIKKIYSQNLDNNLRNSLKGIGYEAGNINIKISDDDKYNIEKIDLQIVQKTKNSEEEKQVYSIIDTVKYVNINISGTGKQDDCIINDGDKETIKKHIGEMYDVSSDKICVY